MITIAVTRRPRRHHSRPNNRELIPQWQSDIFEPTSSQSSSTRRCASCLAARRAQMTTRSSVMPVLRSKHPTGTPCTFSVLHPRSKTRVLLTNKNLKHEAGTNHGDEEEGEEGDPPHSTQHALSATAPHARSSHAALTRAFLLPTRARATGAPQGTALLVGYKSTPPLHLHIYVCTLVSPTTGSPPPSPLPRTKRSSPSFSFSPSPPLRPRTSTSLPNSPKSNAPLPRRARDVVRVPQWHLHRCRGGKDADGRPPGRGRRGCGRAAQRAARALSFSLRPHCPAPSTTTTGGSEEDNDNDKDKGGGDLAMLDLK